MKQDCHWWQSEKIFSYFGRGYPITPYNRAGEPTHIHEPLNFPKFFRLAIQFPHKILSSLDFTDRYVKDTRIRGEYKN